MANLINVERATVGYGTRTLLDEVSLGVEEGDAIGVVGRNGDGKTTLLQVLTGTRQPDSGRLTHTSGLSVGYLRQGDELLGATVRDVIVGGRPDHVWAAEPDTREVVEHLLSGVDLDSDVAGLSGGERRRVALAEVLLGRHDVLVLDEPTNHLDVEVIGWLAEQLNARRPKALVVVSHDRWFLDAVCTRTWEVHDGAVDAYDGGYAAYVLARAERMRLAAGTEARRRNLMRKELAWLRRGPPARTSKPKFRIQAASELIANEPPPRDSLVLQRFATSRLGKDVFDLHRVLLEVGEPPRLILDRVDWSIGPGARIGLVGVNGTGKTSVLRLLAGELQPAAGRIKRGATLKIGYLSQALAELDGDRVLDAVENRRRVTELAGGREISADTLLRDFGFTGDRLTARVADLSGGERRRLQFLRLLLDEPNVLLLDEPTNDLDIDTLTVIEDYLDGWPGTLIVVTHDRYFLERVSDVTYALTGGGRCDLLPGGVEQYLADRAGASEPSARQEVSRGESASARERRAGKEMARIEGQLEKLDGQIAALHETMAQAAHDHVRLGELNVELGELQSRKESLEEAWLAAAED
jgi:ABC transport system ATP-binding/permease protein